MKKTSLANLIIIIGLLILCVMTLIAVYATAPESSVLLLDETFSHLDESKWKHEISECNEDGELYHYDTDDGKTSGLIADGVLHIHPNLTELDFRSKRETFTNCTSCFNSTYPVVDCDSSLFFVKVETKNVLKANRGRIKVRAKLRSRNSIKLYIDVLPNSEPIESTKNYSTLENNPSSNNFSQLLIFFTSGLTEAVIDSEITDDEFHVYEIYWDSEKISLNIDSKKVEEKRFKLSDSIEENNSNKTVKFNSAPISQPFYLKVGVEFAEKELEPSKNNKKDERDEKNVFEIDYIQLYRISD